MSGLILTITNAGRAALVNAANTGTNPVLMASVGVSATAFTPSPGITSLPGEIKRITTIAGEAVADDTIHVTVRDESADVYTVRSFGLYLADGTLFGVYSQANPIMEKSAQAMLLLAIDVIFADIDATQITFGDTSFLNPPATTERQGVVELATEAETSAGDDATRAVVPKGLKSAVTSWINARFGEGAPSNFVKGLLTSASAAALRTALEIKSAALKDEGAGKGLDADLLDGQQGSFYQNASNLNAGTVPAARLSGTYGISISGNAATSTKLATARTLSLSGDVAGSTSFDGSANASIAVTLSASTVLSKLLTVDGSGSGLDADMLDGYQASTTGGINTVVVRDANGAINCKGVARSVTGGVGDSWQDGVNSRFWIGAINDTLYIGRTGATFLGSTGGLTITSGGVFAWKGNTIWHAGNDGSGSGMDADLLDGKHASDFALLTGAAFTGNVSVTGNVNIAATHRLEFGGVPVMRGTTEATWIYAYGTSGILFRNAANTVTLVSINNTDGTISRMGNKVWDAGNDGAGSGLDADLLDGLHASDFAKLADFVASKSASGYCKLPNGMIIQAGRYTQYANTTISISFPLAFPSLCMGVVTSGSGDTSYGAEGNTPTVVSNSVTTTGFQSINANDNNTTAYWIAFGY